MPLQSTVPVLVVLALSLVAIGCSSESSTDNLPPEAAALEELPLEGASETPDWSGLAPNAKRPFDDVVSGGQPSVEQLQQAAAEGFQTVINLRMPGEDRTDIEESEVTGLGMHYVSLPIDGAEGMNEENARALAEVLKSAEGPTLLHCGSGNRVGGLLALAAFHVDGKDAESSIQVGLDAGLTGLEPVVRERLESPSPH